MKSDLSSICDYASGKVKVSSLSKETYISTENMLSDKAGVVSASAMPAMETVQAYKRGDVLVSNIRPYFKKIWQADREGGCSNDVLVFRAKEGVCAEYLFYVLSDDRFFAHSMATSKGTKMPRGDKHAIMQYQIESHGFEVQEKIAEILGSLDAKIKTNRAINDNLQQQAFAVFQHCFANCDCAAEQETTLGQVCECVLGGTPDRSNALYWGGDISWINSGEVNRFRIIHPTETITQMGLDCSATKLLPAKTTVLAITGATLGQYSLLEIPSCANQSVVGVIPNDRLPYEFIYPFIAFNINELLSHQTGGAQQHINKQNIERLPIRLPGSKILRDYTAIVEPLYNLIGKNEFNTANLIEVRDSLLPKFMNGEIDVSGVTL